VTYLLSNPSGSETAPVSPLIIPYGGHTPTISATAFIAPNAVLIGNLEIGDESSIWFNVVIRADVDRITVGRRTNIQDGTVVHVSSEEGGKTRIGDDITIGHMALIHACTLEDGCFVGMSATVMDLCVIESGAMLAAGALLPPRKRIPAGELWAGRPAKFLRKLGDADYENFKSSFQSYVAEGQHYRNILGR
jgi:carbonic anhydrase/acetyltransferase-like protein (isoleucine patch superfamily)